MIIIACSETEVKEFQNTWHPLLISVQEDTWMYTHVHACKSPIWKNISLKHEKIEIMTNLIKITKNPCNQTLTSRCKAKYNGSMKLENSVTATSFGIRENQFHQTSKSCKCLLMFTPLLNFKKTPLYCSIVK